MYFILLFILLPYKSFLHLPTLLAWKHLWQTPTSQQPQFWKKQWKMDGRKLSVEVDILKILNKLLTSVLINRFEFCEVHQVVWSHNCNGANSDHKSLKDIGVQLLGLTAATIQTLHCIAEQRLILITWTKIVCLPLVSLKWCQTNIEF